ncbi:MAG: DUF4922 domain-containing protein [Syntrophales bacterium]|nr:DUF4922 domain-containing protein [Syntrophales bacterium]
MKGINPILAEFFDRQRRTWSEFNGACQALGGAQSKRIEFEGGYFLVQLNPQRRVNVEVTPDDTPCLLCEENLPLEQERMPLGESLYLLCNPRPIFPYHFTLASRQHEKQAIEGREKLLLDVAKELGPGVALFYNGPHSGASIPFHFHFQAVPFSNLPIHEDRRWLKWADLSVVALVNHQIRSYFFLRGTDRDALIENVRRFMMAWKKVSASEDEPMVNIIVAFEDGLWLVYIFPRRGHRPKRFFASEGEKIIVTPGAVEMGGVIVTVRERDFLALNERILQEIMSDVCVAPEVLDDIVRQCKCL